MIPEPEDLFEKGPAFTLATERPVRIRVTPCGIKLAFFHNSRPLLPFKVTIPHEQWMQMAYVIAEELPEAFVGFTPETIALHCIDAVELSEGLRLSLPPRVSHDAFFSTNPTNNNED